MQENELPRIVKILLHLLQRRDLELKTAATSFLIRLYAQVKRVRERARERESERESERATERGRERERCSEMQYTREALVLRVVLRMKLDLCDGKGRLTHRVSAPAALTHISLCDAYVCTAYSGASSLKLLVYEALSYKCMRPYATSV